MAKGLAKTPIFQDESSAESMLNQVGKIVYFLVFILFLPAVFTALNMTNVSEPITNMMSQILNYIPNIIATAIVNTAFLLILGGLMIAFAISFGLGGREFAKNMLGKLQNKFEKEDKVERL